MIFNTTIQVFTVVTDYFVEYLIESPTFLLNSFILLPVIRNKFFFVIHLTPSMCLSTLCFN